MSLQSIRKPPSSCEARCPICEVMLSRQADLNRHMKSQHPTGTEMKFPCPHRGCRYQATQKGNLKAHTDAKHSDGPQYPCPECGQLFGDAAARIRHRKNNHRYKPYHTSEYHSRQLLKEKEVPRSGKAVSNKTRSKRAARAAPYSLPHSLSSDTSAPPSKFHKVSYHYNFSKTLLKMARYYAANPERLEELRVRLPSVIAPGCPTPDSEAIQSIVNVSTQAVAPMQPSLAPSDVSSGLFSTRLDDVSRQEQDLVWPSTQPEDNIVTSVFPSDSTFISPAGIDMTSFTPGVSPSYSGEGFSNYIQDFSTPSYNDVLLPMTDAITVPTTTITPPSPPSTDLMLPFTTGLAALPEPVPEPSSSPTSSLAIPTLYPQFDLFTPGNTNDSDAWWQLYFPTPGPSSQDGSSF